MLKKTIRRLGALAMVLAMAVSVFAVNASAAEATRYDAITEATFNKTVSNTQANYGYNPVTTFTFSVAPATATEGEEYAGAPVYSGVLRALV